MSHEIDEERTIKCRNEYAPQHQDVGEESATKQAFKEQCDINYVVRTHAQSGMWAHINPREPHFGDFSQAINLQGAIATLRAAEDDFNALPARVRRAADNDPEVFLQMCANEDDFYELVDAGLPISDEHRRPEPPAEPEETAAAPPAPAAETE